MARKKKAENGKGAAVNEILPEIEKLENELVRYEFTDEELQELGQQLAQDFKVVQRIEDEARNVAKKYKSDIEATKLSIYDLARWIRERYDMRNCEVFCYKDYSARRAYYWRTDQVDLVELRTDIMNSEAGEFIHEPVKEREISHHELQRHLPLDDTGGDDAADPDGDNGKVEVKTD